MTPTTLLLAIHNHQPEGNFGEVFARAYHDCYLPLVDLLLEFPSIRCALHFTGSLLEWIEHNQPDLLGKLRELCDRAQIELLGGGFYEPMLAILPERDALGQLRMMSDYLEHHFGRRPRGLWLAERVWEPGLPVLLHQAGLAFTMLDDGHFRYAGVEGRLRGYYVTEKAGAATAIFPIDKDLRYAIPFAEAPKTIALLESFPEGAYTYGDDGEKFGMWPGTRQWVWDRGWLRQFFSLLDERKDRIGTELFSDYLAAHPPTGRIYLPTASYEEMGEWALPPDAQARYHCLRQSLEARGDLEAALPFLRGGIWQNFLAKYDEANFMHKKMIYVSDKLAHLGRTGEPQPALAEARRELYRAQCNCAYWHGLFGGLYLGYLRYAVYHHLIAAEVVAEPGLKSRLVRRDYDVDFQEELIVETPELGAIIKPSYGGAMVELDCRTRRVNLFGVMSRREEGYHQKLRKTGEHKDPGQSEAVRSIHDMTRVKQEGLEQLLVIDRHLRLGFLDHFLPKETTLADLSSSQATEAGDFVGAPYAVQSASAQTIVLERQGSVLGIATRLVKTYGFAGKRLTVHYRIESERPLEVLFAPELSLFWDTAAERNRPASEHAETSTFRLEHDWLAMDLALRMAPAARLWRFPLEVASQSEDGFERTYQGTVIVPLWQAVGAQVLTAAMEIELCHA